MLECYVLYFNCDVKVVHVRAVMLLNMPVWVVLHYVEERIWSEHGVLSL